MTAASAHKTTTALAMHDSKTVRSDVWRTLPATGDDGFRAGIRAWNKREEIGYNAIFKLKSNEIRSL